MARIIRGRRKEWTNYHQTIEQDVRLLRFAGLDPQEPPGRRLATIARLVGAELARGSDIRPLGAAWSFSRLHGTDGDLLSTDGAAGVYQLSPDMLEAGADGLRLRLVASGTTIKQLNRALDEAGLSLRTSGASNGQSMAGAMATGTHGSVPGVGAFQDHIRGIHLLTGPNRSIWLEPAGSRLLADGFARSFADEIVSSDPLFQAALVHLGGLGYVNAVLFEAADTFLVGIVQRKAVLGSDAIAELGTGEFSRFAARFGYGDPYFVQVILNPFKPSTTHALVRLLVPVDPKRVELLPFLASDVEFDPLNILGWILELLPDGCRGEAIAKMMRLLYPVFPKSGTMPPGKRWSETTPDHRRVGDLFSTGVTIERHRLEEALDVILPAFRMDDGGDTVCTLRFVKQSQGTLAITRWADNVVIDFDGLRTKASKAAYKRVIAALDAAQIPARQHWGKLSLLDADRVRRDHGAAVGHWRQARTELLSQTMQDVFRSDALVSWGLA